MYQEKITIINKLTKKQNEKITREYKKVEKLIKQLIKEELIKAK